jgi:hypothetical protein
MLRRFILVLGAVALAFALVPASSEATVVLFDDFNGENGGTGVLNYTGFTNWTVSGGTVDLIGNGYFDFFPTNGLYVDLDGSTGAAGLLADGPFAAGKYVLSFWLAGSQRGDTNSVLVGFGGTSDTITLASSVPFTLYTYSFTAAAPFQLSFHNAGGDNVGLLLDNVTLDAVPEPGTLLLLGSGLSALALRRRRKA